MRRVHTDPGEGWKIQSNRGWFFLGIGTRIFSFHLELGRFGVTIEKKRGKR
jgi:hypothetical protein